MTFNFTSSLPDPIWLVCQHVPLLYHAKNGLIIGGGARSSLALRVCNWCCEVVTNRQCFCFQLISGNRWGTLLVQIILPALIFFTDVLFFCFYFYSYFFLYISLCCDFLAEIPPCLSVIGFLPFWYSPLIFTLIFSASERIAVVLFLESVDVFNFPWDRKTSREIITSHRVISLSNSLLAQLFYVAVSTSWHLNFNLEFAGIFSLSSKWHGGCYVPQNGGQTNNVYCMSGNIFTPNNLSLPNIRVGFTFMYLIAYLWVNTIIRKYSNFCQ